LLGCIAGQTQRLQTFGLGKHSDPLGFVLGCRLLALFGTLELGELHVRAIHFRIAVQGNLAFGGMPYMGTGWDIFNRVERAAIA